MHRKNVINLKKAKSMAQKPLAPHQLLNLIERDQELVTYSDDVRQTLFQCNLDHHIEQILKGVEIVLEWQDSKEDILHIKEQHDSLNKVTYRLDYDQEMLIRLKTLSDVMYFTLPDFLTGEVEWSAFDYARQQLTPEELEILHVGITSLHPEDQQYTARYVSLVNKFARSINHYMHDPKIKRKLRDRAANCQANKLRCVELTKALFERHSKILVIRLDLSLQRELQTLTKNYYSNQEVHSKNDLAYMKECTQKLLEKKRYHPILKDMIGYIFRFEYSVRTGFHVHAYCFFDANKHREDITIAQGIAKIWKEDITGGQGSAFICNMKKDSYRYCGIGTIHHSDQLKQEYLFQTFDYICKADQFFIFLNLKGARRFQSSEIPEDKPKVGRPRKETKSSPNKPQSSDDNMESCHE